MKVSVLYTRNHRLLSLVAIIDVFETVNRFLVDDGLPAPFQLELVGLRKTTPLPENLEHLPYVALPDARAAGGIIVIPAFKDHEMEKVFAVFENEKEAVELTKIALNLFANNLNNTLQEAQPVENLTVEF